MHNQPQVKLIFLVFGGLLLGFSPVLIVLVPLFFPVTFFYEKHTWVYYTPWFNHVLFGIAIGLLILACLTILFFKNKFVLYSLTTILTVSALMLVVGSSVSYLKITQEGLKYRSPFQLEEQVYKWSEIEKMEYYPPANNETERAKYVVSFNNGEMYQFIETVQVDMIRSSIKMMLEQNKVPFRNMDMDYGDVYTSE